LPGFARRVAWVVKKMDHFVPVWPAAQYSGKIASFIPLTIFPGFLIFLAPRFLMTKPTKTASPKSFESALTELEQVVSSMEAGQMPLEQSLAAYQRGMELLKYCQAALKDAQQQVKILESGSLVDFHAEGNDSGASE
jgi:exodeoxyribonuclease VII small subunit